MQTNDSSTRPRAKVKSARPSAALRRRAEAIIDDFKVYDVDTREAVKYSLRNNSPDLAELVRRAEGGEMIVDCAAVQEKNYKAALKVLDFINAGDIPDFVTGAVFDALWAAQHTTGFDLGWCTDAPPSPKARAREARELAKLFGILGPLFDLKKQRQTRAGLADLLVEVLAHPELPTNVYNDLGDALSSYTVREDAAFIKLLLDNAAREETEPEGEGDAGQ